MSQNQCGRNAARYLKRQLPLEVLQSAAGFYIGTMDEQGPASRESQEYWRYQEQAQQALEQQEWSQLEY